MDVWSLVLLVLAVNAFAPLFLQESYLVGIGQLARVAKDPLFKSLVLKLIQGTASPILSVRATAVQQVRAIP
jgi:hypothetical protein